MMRMFQAGSTTTPSGWTRTGRHRIVAPPCTLREVETLETTQDEIRDSLAKIAERLPYPDGNSQ